MLSLTAAWEVSQVFCQSKKPGFEEPAKLPDYTQYVWMEAKGAINRA
ncbi:MAG: hypothetical protein IMF07_08965 [Proteobacteria bacterium]|nr:hypothetical protein [Pseudomonadota bacterium]